MEAKALYRTLKHAAGADLMLFKVAVQPLLAASKRRI
jgi:hypothetical protein